MGLKTSTGFVAIAISTNFEEKDLVVHWATFPNENYREYDPIRRWVSISERGTHVFNLAIKELDENGNEIITGYLPQTKETAHTLLKELSIDGANFKAVNFQIV